MSSTQPSPSATDLTSWLEGATAAAKSAGQLLLDCSQRPGGVEIHSKTTHVDLVSAADKEAEDLLRNALGKVLPEAGFIGEESPFPDLSRHELFWCVDPLDGTSNFLCGLPVWCTSIALVNPALEPLLGVIEAPTLDRTWTAMTGGGAQLNGRTVQVRLDPPGGGMHNAMLATGFPYDVGTAIEHSNINLYTAMQRRFQKIRRLGSAAIDLGFLADGTYDGLWELKPAPWDSAAGILLVREAGGLICTIDGDGYTPGDLSLVAAATPELMEFMLAVLRGAA